MSDVLDYLEEFDKLRSDAFASKNSLGDRPPILTFTSDNSGSTGRVGRWADIEQ